MANLFRQAFAVIFIGTVSAVFAISFAAIIYVDELAPYFDRGIGLTLLGSTMLSITGAFCLSYRGSIVQPQDVPAILLSGGVATWVAKGELSGEVLFATAACLISVATLATGLVAMLIGRFRLAMLARYIPYPVLAGFLAATGLLLFIGGVGVAVGMSPESDNLGQFFQMEALLKWGPMCIAAVGIVYVTRVFSGHLTLPLALLATALFFYVIIAALGLSADEARSAGFLLGPFNGSSFVTFIGPQVLGQADWSAIASLVPVIVTIVAISLVGTTLNASGLELEIGRDLDINREVSGVGIGNTLSAFLGGMPGYHLLGETILAQRLGLTGAVAGISSAVGCAVVLLLGGSVLAAMPVGLFATVIAFLGVDLLYTWLWAERKNLALRDYAIVAFIPIIAVTYSFLMAIAAGLVVAFVLFVIAYAKLDVIRSHSSVAVRRSFVERPDADLQILAVAGGAVQIIELSGYLFFASANVLRDRIKTLLADDAQSTAWLVLDFKHVSGVDISSWHMLQRVISDCDARQVSVLLSAVDPFAAGEKADVLPADAAVRFATLDHALEHAEDALLTQNMTSDAALAQGSLTDITAFFTSSAFDGYIHTVTAKAGDVVIKRGADSNEIYILKSGQLSVSAPQKDGNAAVVAKIRQHSIFGEMAYYSGRTRTADVIADGPVALLRIDMSRIGEFEQQHPAVAFEFHKAIAHLLARRLNRTTVLLRDLGF